MRRPQQLRARFGESRGREGSQRGPGHGNNYWHRRATGRDITLLCATGDSGMLHRANAKGCNLVNAKLQTFACAPLIGGGKGQQVGHGGGEAMGAKGVQTTTRLL